MKPLNVSPGSCALTFCLSAGFLVPASPAALADGTAAPQAAPADKLAPLVTITLPARNSETTALTTVTGLASDEGSGLDRVDVVITRLADNYRWNGSVWQNQENGLRATVTGNGQLGTTWALPPNRLPSGTNLHPGAYMFKAVAYDLANNSAIYMRGITVVDVRPPLVAITSRANNQTVADLSGLAGTVSDIGGSGVGKVTLVIVRPDGARWNGWLWTQQQVGIPTVVSGTTWTMVTPAANGANLPTGANLPPAAYRVTAAAYDVAGNVTISTVTLNVQPPAAPALSPSGGHA